MKEVSLEVKLACNGISQEIYARYPSEWSFAHSTMLQDLIQPVTDEIQNKVRDVLWTSAINRSRKMISSDLTEMIEEEYGEIQTIEDLRSVVADLVATFIENKTKIARNKDLGLDTRAGYALRVAEDGVVCPKSSDGSLQYYGGFEYIDKEDRCEIGEYVFYLSSDSRVSDCLDRILDKQEAEEKTDETEVR